MHKASCLCGAIRADIDAELTPPDACHCSMCRRQSGHFWASTDLVASAVTIHGKENLSWYCASKNVQRGFCSNCGSFLFWKAINGDKLSIAMGAIEAPTGVSLAKHIFVADKGDYYDLGDDLPKNAQ